MKRDEALSIIAGIAKRNDATVFVGNGSNARAFYVLADEPHVFYMVGSMGLCPTLAAGFSHSARTPVIAVEGDGNALMGLSGFPVASNAAGMENAFVHVVFDNGLYETTGGQLTLSYQVDFVQLASSSGYDHCYHPDTPQTLTMLLETALQEKQKAFFFISTEVSTEAMHPRVPFHPRIIAQRFRDAIASRQNF